VTDPPAPRSRTGLLLAVLLTVAALAVALVVNARDDGSDTPSPSGAGVQAVRAGGVALLREATAPTGFFGGVGVDERLALLDGGCLGLAGHDPDLLVVFPPGSELGGTDDDPVVTSDDVSLHLGDRVIGGSRFPQPQPLARLGSLASGVPDGCRGLLAVPVQELVPAPVRVPRPDLSDIQGAWLLSGTDTTMVVSIEGLATYGGCGGVLGRATLFRGAFDLGGAVLADTDDCGQERNVGRALQRVTRASLEGRVLTLSGPGLTDLTLSPRTHEPPDTES
jgi:hypothetical protein